ncbi:MAG TPA: addiction module protein [Gemmataceae bacterium]|nr:addiction module protein [Gemmataceae bacterium]
MDLEATLVEINQLPVPERIDFVQRVLEGISEDSEVDDDEFELSPEQRAELERRIALADADPGRGVSWEEVEAKMIAREQG